jgi:hypothetical protein
MPDIQHHHPDRLRVPLADFGGPPHTGRPVQFCAAQDAVAKILGDPLQAIAEAVGGGRVGAPGTKQPQAESGAHLACLGGRS